MKLMVDQCALYLFSVSLDANIEDDVWDYFMFCRYQKLTKIWKHVVVDDVVATTTIARIVGPPISSPASSKV